MMVSDRGGWCGGCYFQHGLDLVWFCMTSDVYDERWRFFVFTQQLGIK